MVVVAVSGDFGSIGSIRSVWFGSADEREFSQGCDCGGFFVRASLLWNWRGVWQRIVSCDGCRGNASVGLAKLLRC